MNERDATGAAVELAERILEEAARPVQNWCKIARWARELAVLAAALAARREPGPTAEEL